jgi:DNA-binding PadR family transcriptional regulator
MPKSPSPQEFLPLRPIELLVLVVLADTDLHGYAIRQAIIAQTGGAVQVDAGNLYRHIRRLQADLLIELAPSRLTDDERRRHFRLAPLGRRVLAAELDRLDALVRHARARGIMGAARPRAHA